jgi:hypothetical protein
MTSTESWEETYLKALQEGRTGFDPDSDRRGPISIAVVATITPEKKDTTAGSTESSEPPEPGQSAAAHAARLVVFGDSEFANNNLFSVQGNGNLFLNTVSWLAEEEDLIAIRPRKGGGSGPVMLTAGQGWPVFWLPVGLLPRGVLASGAVDVPRRKWQQ